MPVLNSSPYELVRKGLLSLYVTRLSLNIPDSLMNLCTVEQLTLPLITFQVGVPVGHNSHTCCLRAKRDTLIHFLPRSEKCVCVCVQVCVCDYGVWTWWKGLCREAEKQHRAISEETEDLLPVSDVRSLLPFPLVSWSVLVVFGFPVGLFRHWDSHTHKRTHTQ